MKLFLRLFLASLLASSLSANYLPGDPAAVAYARQAAADIKENIPGAAFDMVALEEAIAARFGSNEPFGARDASAGASYRDLDAQQELEEWRAQQAESLRRPGFTTPQPVRTSPYKKNKKKRSRKKDHFDIDDEVPAGRAMRAALPIGYHLMESDGVISVEKSSWAGDVSELTTHMFSCPDEMSFHYLISGEGVHETMAQTSYHFDAKRTSVYPTRVAKSGSFHYTDPETGNKITFGKGHGIDFVHGDWNSTFCEDNYTPQNRYYNEHIRGPLASYTEKVLRGSYREVAVYGRDQRFVKMGVPIPEGFIFIMYGHDDQPFAAYYFPNWIDYHEVYDQGYERAKSGRWFSKRTKLGLPTSKAWYIADQCKLDADLIEEIFSRVEDDAQRLASVATLFHTGLNVLAGTLSAGTDNVHLRRHVALALLTRAANNEHAATYVQAYLASLLTGWRHVQPEDGAPVDCTDLERVGVLLSMIAGQCRSDLRVLEQTGDVGLVQVVLNELVDLKRLYASHEMFASELEEVEGLIAELLVELRDDGIIGLIVSE